METSSSDQSRHGLVTVVVDGQYGSTGKGAVCGFLAYEDAGSGQAHVGVRVGGSQAGHTVVDTEGRPWPLRHVPVAFVNPDAALVIAAGSEVDLDVLNHEVRILEEAGFKIADRLYVDAQATWLEPDFLDREAAAKLNERLGSTGKGVGAARAARIMRSARLVSDAPLAGWDVPGEITDTAAVLRAMLAAGRHVVIEGTQGFALGLHAGFYPFCTSTDCRAIDFLAQAGLSPWSPGIDVRVVVTVRTHPIRVAGNSGPMRGETTWEALGLPEELTTVTRKVRRVGRWDPTLVRDAVLANGGPSYNVVLAVTMLDHMFRDQAGKRNGEISAEAYDWLDTVSRDTGAEVALTSTGPGLFTVVNSEAWR